MRLPVVTQRGKNLFFCRAQGGVLVPLAHAQRPARGNQGDEEDQADPPEPSEERHPREGVGDALRLPLHRERSRQLPGIHFSLPTAPLRPREDGAT